MRNQAYNLTVLGIILFSLLQSSVLRAELIQLQYDNVPFPVVIAFPVSPQAVNFTNPALPGSMYYHFTVQDEDAALSYAVLIMNIPQNLGFIPEETARMMINISLDTQISGVDALVGAPGKVVKSSTEPLNNYPSKYLEVARQTTPQLFGVYRAVFVDRLLITAWASGFDSENNRSKAKHFVQSLGVQPAL